MYLSQLKLNPTHPAARRDLGDAYQMHRTLSRAFATGPDGLVPRFLWRLERESAPGASNSVLVQADGPGHWSELADLPGYLLGSATDKLVDLERLITDSRSLRFRLRANPAVKREGKRWGLHNEAEQLAWLSRQGTRLGFELQGADVSQRERVRVPQSRSGMHITVDCVQFDGQLGVTNAPALRQGLLTGVGPAKALGLGLLSLAPI